MSKFQKIQKEDTKEKFESTVNLRQINGFAVSSDRIHQLSLTGNYFLKESWSFSLGQTLNHHHWLNPDSKDLGFRIQDTILALNKEFTPYETQLTLSFSSTLPMSNHSQVNNILTVSTAYLRWDLKLDPLLNVQSKWIKNSVFFIEPFSRYHFSIYKTTPTKGQSSGGTPLPKFSFGIQNVGLKFDVTDYFSLRGSYGRWIIFPYKIPFKNKVSIYDRSYGWHYYTFSLAGDLTVKEKWKLSLSYSHLDRLDKDGHIKFVVFDYRLSTWAVSLTYLFSLASKRFL